MPTVISIENLSKSYRLGTIGTGMLTYDLNRWWARVRKQPDPYLRIGQEDRSHLDGELMWALRDINLQVQQGEALGIIGRNGAGKSTLLKILSRVTAPTTGAVKVKGRIASLLEVGTGFHPELTGRENVYLNGAIFGMTRAEVTRKLDEIIDFSGVEKYIDTPVKRYSSGMYVRLAFAVAAHLDPEILIVDEVLAVGDAEFQKKCLGKMGDVAGEGRTVLFVSHNMAAISSLCRRAILLSSGTIDEVGEPGEIISRYLIRDVSSNGCVEFKPKPGQMEKIIISRIEIKNADGNTSAQFFMGDKAIFEIVITSHELTKQLSVCLYIKTTSGIPVIHSFNEDANVFFDDFNGIKIIRAVIPEVDLYPGSYSVSVWIGDRIGNGYDHKKDCLIFNVDKSAKLNRRNLSWDYGLVKSNFQWNVVDY